MIGDAWFGSVRTVEELMDVGLHSIMNVKQGCAGYPKALMLEGLKERDDRVWFKVDVEFYAGVKHVYAGGHKDKAPLLLAATCGTSLDGKEAVRHHSHLKDERVERKTYTLPQPRMHAMYRKYSNTVDVCNKVALGPGTIQDVWQTKKVNHRLFGFCLVMCETNAYHTS